MTTKSDNPPGDGYREPWRARVAADLAAHATEQQRLWGGIDELMLARYEAGVSPDAERARVERAMRDHPALRECVEISRELNAEWQKAASPPVPGKPGESRPQPPVLSALDPAAIESDPADRSIHIPRPSSRNPLHRWLAIAAAVVAIVGLGLAYRSAWRPPSPKAPPEIVKKDSPKPDTIVVEKGEGATNNTLPPFEDALSALEKRVSAGIDPKEFRRAYDGLLQDYPDHKDEIESNELLAAVLARPNPAVIARKPDSEPSPPDEKALLLADIAEMNQAFPPAIPLNVAKKEVQELWKRVVQYQEKYPEPEIPEMAAFAMRAEATPEHKVLYAVHRAKALSGKPASDPEVQRLWEYVAGLGDDLVAGNPVLKAFLVQNPPDTPAGVQTTLRVKLAGLAEEAPAALKPPRGRPYLLCVLPPGLRQEALDVHRRARQFATKHPELLDERLEGFLMRARRPVASDTVGVIVPTYDPNLYNMGLPNGAALWNRLIAAGDPNVPITAVVNIVINPDMLPDKGVNGVRRDDAVAAYINRAKAASLTMLACLDCTPGFKTAQSLGNEIDLWVTLYGNLDGFYLYNAPLNDMEFIYRYIRTKYHELPIIVYETKALPQQDLLASRAADERFIIFVNNSGTPVSEFKPPGWIAKYNPNRFGGVFKGTQANLAASIDLAAAQHLGGVFISDNGSQLPGFWPEEIALIQQLNVRILSADNALKPATKRNRGKVSKGK